MKRPMQRLTLAIGALVVAVPMAVAQGNGNGNGKGNARNAAPVAGHCPPGLAKKNPKWMVAGELIETSRLFAHTVAGVDPKWIEKAADHLVTREHYEPHWEKRRGQAELRALTTF